MGRKEALEVQRVKLGVEFKESLNGLLERLAQRRAKSATDRHARERPRRKARNREICKRLCKLREEGVEERKLVSKLDYQLYDSGFWEEYEDLNGPTGVTKVALREILKKGRAFPFSSGK